MCARKPRYIRYIVDSQLLNPLHLPLQPRYTPVTFVSVLTILVGGTGGFGLVAPTCPDIPSRRNLVKEEAPYGVGGPVHHSALATADSSRHSPAKAEAPWRQRKWHDTNPH